VVSVRATGFGLALLAELFASGCGLAAQTIAGWTTREVRTRPVEGSVSIEAPPDAEVIRRGPHDPSSRSLGIAPTQDTVTFEEEVTIEHTGYWGLLIGGLVDAALMGLVIASAHGDENRVRAGAEGIALIAAPELIAALLLTGSEGNIVERRSVVGSDRYAYAAVKDGQVIANADLLVSQSSRAMLLPKAMSVTTPLGVFTNQVPGEPESPTVPLALAPAPRPKPVWYVRIQPAQDTTAAPNASALDGAIVKRIADILRASLERQGVHASERERSPTHVLFPRVARTGDRCVLNAELFDTAIHEIAAVASSAGACGDVGVAKMSEDVATALLEFGR
jgi:hypothetical protein